MLRPSGANPGPAPGRSSAAVSARGVAALHGDDRQMLGVVDHPDRLGRRVARVGDPVAVGTPGRCVVGSRIVGEPPHRIALRRVVARHQPEVVVVGAVHAVTVAHERDQPAVGRPFGIIVVVIAGRDLAAAPGRDVEHEQVGAAMIEVAPAVPLELQPVDHPRRGCLGRPAIPRGVTRLLRRGVPDHERQARGVGRPGEAVHPLLDLGELLGLAAQPVEPPDLRLAARARGEEREVLAVGAPARARRRRALGGHRDRLAAVQRRHPDLGFGLVVLQARCAHDVGHPAAVGTELRTRHPFDLEEIVHGDEPAGRLLGADGDGQQREQGGDGDTRRSSGHGDSGWRMDAPAI